MPSSALRRGELVRIRDQRWTISETAPHPDATVVTVVGCDRSNRGRRARYLLPFEPIERLPSVDTTRIVSHRRWRRLVRGMLARTAPSIESLMAPLTAQIEILPYQLEPAMAAVRGSTRILIADDVGLGKTVQAGLIVAETLARRSDAHVLVLCPAGLRQQWHDELTQRFQLTPVVLDSAALARVPLVDGANPWSACPLVLTSTDYIKRPEVVRALEPLLWDLLVIDEAHGVAGPSDRHDATMLLAERARTVVMLTATPHSGDASAFERMTSVGDLGAAFPLTVFRRTRADAGGRMDRRTRWLRIRPTRPEADMHRALMAYVTRVWRQPASSAARLAMIILTRRACSSAASLASTLERRLTLLHSDSPFDEQLRLPWSTSDVDVEVAAELGAPGLADAASERRALEAILSLARRAAVSESKIDALARFLRRSNEQAIVFTEYRDTLASLDRELARSGTCQLHGGLSTSERAETIREFTTGQRRVLLATDAASEGLNLQQRCRLVVHLEVPWSPTRIEQRVGRVDRIGQSRAVHQIHLVAAGTVEESRVTRVVQRSTRIASELGALSAPPLDERQTADYIVGNERLPVHANPVAVLPGLIAGNLRPEAIAEAARLRHARQMRDTRAAAPAPYVRPVAARARRTMPGSSYWVFWIEFADSEGQVVWETLVGVQGSHRPLPALTRTDRSRFFDASWNQLRQVLMRECLGTTVETSSPRTLAREHAIASAVEQRHARIASVLVQGALFDRRGEREAGAQREMLEHARVRCHTRIADLQRARIAAAVAVRPAFSLVAW